MSLFKHKKVHKLYKKKLDWFSCLTFIPTPCFLRQPVRLFLNTKAIYEMQCICDGTSHI